MFCKSAINDACDVTVFWRSVTIDDNSWMDLTIGEINSSYLKPIPNGPSTYGAKSFEDIPIFSTAAFTSCAIKP